MRFPWTRRADEARERRIEAEKRKQCVMDDWPAVRQVASDARHHYELNGWTGTITVLFAARKRGEEK